MFPRRTVFLAASAIALASPVLAQSPASTRAPRETNVIDALTAAGGHGVFIGLAQLSGAVEHLRGLGPFILLAPSDAALSRLPASVLAGLAPPPGTNAPSTDPIRLAAFVNSHIIEGRGSLDALRGRTTTMQTRNGNAVEFTAADGGAFRVVSTGDGGFGTGGINLDPRERLIRSEVVATNGVIWPVSLPFVV